MIKNDVKLCKSWKWNGLKNSKNAGQQNLIWWKKWFALISCNSVEFWQKCHKQFAKFWFFHCCRPCVRFVWIVWKTWSSCADTALAKCAATGCRSVQYVARRSTSAFCSTKNKRQSPTTLRTGISRGNNYYLCESRCESYYDEYVQWDWITIRDRSRQFVRKKSWSFLFTSHLFLSDRILCQTELKNITLFSTKKKKKKNRNIIWHEHEE